MISKMNINIDMNEARTLVAGGDLKNVGTLNLDEFMDMVFLDSDKFNVDLSKLKVENEK